MSVLLRRRGVTGWHLHILRQRKGREKLRGQCRCIPNPVLSRNVLRSRLTQSPRLRVRISSLYWPEPGACAVWPPHTVLVSPHWLSGDPCPIRPLQHARPVLPLRKQVCLKFNFGMANFATLDSLKKKDAKEGEGESFYAGGASDRGGRCGTSRAVEMLGVNSCDRRASVCSLRCAVNSLQWRCCLWSWR